MSMPCSVDVVQMLVQKPPGYGKFDILARLEGKGVAVALAFGDQDFIQS